MKLRAPRAATFQQLLVTETSCVPAFLCPALSRPLVHRPSPTQRRCFSSFYRRRNQATSPSPTEDPQAIQGSTHKESLLPLACSGCGALSQTVDSSQAGFYNLSRSAVKAFLKQGAKETSDENIAFSEALQNANTSILQQLGLGKSTNQGKNPQSLQSSIF